jgi:hypothetical protein
MDYMESRSLLERRALIIAVSEYNNPLQPLPFCRNDGEELQELAVASSAFWSNILHVENYDYNTFVKELQQIGEYMSKQK